jgi:hypothetical protein
MDQEQSAESRSEESQDQPQDMGQQPGTDTGQSDAGGADSAAEKGQKQDESSEGITEAEAEANEAKEKVKALEEDPPEKLEDWPDDDAKYETFGGPEGEHGYHEGPEQNLGPSAVRHHEDGSVELEGEKVDDPDEYKGDPIPGGPTDPNAPKVSGERDLSDGGGEEGEGEEKGGGS